MAGQEGLEPPTFGFGVRCSANLSYCPTLRVLLFDLPVKGMPSIPGAILPKLKPIGRVSTVLRGSIVNPFAFGAL